MKQGVSKMDIPLPQELRQRLAEFEKARDELMLYNPTDESESVKQKNDLKLLTAQIQLHQQMLKGGIHRRDN
jgi:hypothetical protein